MKATIEKELQLNDACKVSITLREGSVSALIPCVFKGKKGKIVAKGSYEAICDAVARNFELLNLSLSKCGFHEMTENNKWLPEYTKLSDAETTELTLLASDIITTEINEHKEYLLDNHHDFNVDLSNALERMFFDNHGVSGRTCISKAESDMDKIYDTDFAGELLSIEFEANYKIEFEDESKEDVVMKGCVVNSFTAKESKQNPDGQWNEFDVTLDEQEEVDLKRRIIHAIEDNFNDIKHNVTESLGGNPIE